MVRIHPDPPTGLTGKSPKLHDWGISSAGRAPALQAGGRRFDPVILHQSLMHSILQEQLNAGSFALAIEPVRAM